MPGLEHEWDQKSVEFPLTAESVVFEVGGYIGRWAYEIAKRFDPHLYVFEPQAWAAEQCMEVLHPFPKARVYEFGLGTSSGWFQMGDFETDGASFVNFPSARPTNKGKIVRIEEFLKDRKIEHIDLMMMNIEGYEFTLLPYMLENDLLSTVDYLVVQFHPRNETDFPRIVERLNKVKKIRWDYGKTLMCWEPK